MLRALRQGSRWIMWIVILGVGGVFVLFLGFQGSFRPAPSPEVVVALGDRHYTARDLDRVRRNQESQYRQALGDGFDPEAASAFLDQQAAGALLRSALLAAEAERMGLVVSDAEVRAYLRSLSGAVDENGHLDRDVVTAYAEQNFGSVRRFQESLRDELLARKALQLLSGSAMVSDQEARQAILYRKEEVRIAAVKLGGGDPPADLEVPEEAVQELLRSKPERVRKAYDRRRSEFDRPEQVRARHILIRAPEGDAAARKKARQRIEAIRKRLLAGADFAEMAERESEDPGSKGRGGDLGFFSRGSMAAPFEKVAFSLEPGVLSDLVETVHGFHLIRVEEKRAARVVPFEQAREKVARDLLRQDRAREQARAQAEALSKAIRDGASLVDAAREQGLTLLRPDPIRRRPDGTVPELGPAPEVVTAAFALRPEAPSDPTIYEVGDAFVLVQLLERMEPDAETVDALLDETRQQLLLARRTALENAWLEQLRRQAAERGELVYDLSQLSQL